MAQTKEGALKLVARAAGVSIEKYISLVDAGLKKCRDCKEWKSRDDFIKDVTRHDRLGYLCSSCRLSPNPYASLKGRVHTAESNKLRSETLKERYRNQTHHLKGRSSPRKGIPRTIEERKKISATLRISTKVLRGKDCHSYKDGRLAERRDIRFSRQGKRWRMDVYLRDSFTCQDCGDDKGGNLIAHHIKSFANYPDLRFDVDNGLTLCDKCHTEVHYGKN